MAINNPFPLIDNSWTLFLDRDGVINSFEKGKTIGSIKDFNFIAGSIEGIVMATQIFGRIIVVTNQQGVFTHEIDATDLEKIHFYIQDCVKAKKGKIDAIYYCPYPSKWNPRCRKPNPGMAIWAKQDFPEIDFKKSIIIGDSKTDMEFGANLGMFKILIDNQEINESIIQFDAKFNSLKEAISHMTRHWNN
jgi:histidinol-phosphate phosphatase family protein